METSVVESNPIRLQIQVKAAEGPREVVKKATAKGYEVVEVDGFTFVRKRKAPEQPSQPSPKHIHVEAGEDLHPAAEPEASLGAGVAAAGSEDSAPAAPEAQEAVPSGEAAQEPSSPDQQQQQQDQPQVELPQQEERSPEEELHARLSECLPAGCPTLIKLQFALEHLLMHGAAKMDRQCAVAAAQGQAADASASTQPGSVTAAAGALLHAFSALLQEEVETSQQLMLQPGAEGVARFHELPPLLREASQGSLLRVSLQRQLKQLQDEEAAWLQLRARCTKQTAPDAAGEGAAPANGDAQEGAGVDAVEGADAPAAGTGVEEQPGSQPSVVSHHQPNTSDQQQQEQQAPEQEQQQPAAEVAQPTCELQRVQQEVDAQISTQVESLQSMLTKVEQLLVVADQASKIMHADFHQEKFRAFPHVNSPLVLIKNLIRPPAL